MRPISKANREIINTDPFFKKCIRAIDETCKGRITIEHTFIYAGRQIEDLWSLVPLCEYHHSVCSYQDIGSFNKEIGQAVALTRATEDDLHHYPKVNWNQKKKYLYAKQREYLPKSHTGLS